VSDEFWTIIGSDMLRWPMFNEQISQHVDDVVRPKAPQWHHGQALSAELVDDVEHPEFAPVVGPILDEIIGPDMPAMLWAKADARPVAHPPHAVSR